MSADRPLASVSSYPLLDALRERRSRRFCAGMRMEAGPLSYRSGQAPMRLTEAEEALLAFAACGVTGHALADLAYGPAQGGTILAGFLGRTVASGDALHTVSVFVTNHDATYLLKRPRDFSREEFPEVVALARSGEFTELYRRSRVKIRGGRVSPPLKPLYNLNVNHWSLYDPAGTYFIPVNELTHLYINGVLEILDAHIGAFIVDERAGFRPAGIARFARSRGGFLRDDPRDEMTLTIQQLDSLVTEFVTIEQGMVLQSLALMAQAMGLGGFPHWAAHPFGWLAALGFRTQSIPATRYLAMNPLLRFVARALRRDVPVTHAVGLELDGAPLLVPFCPPYYPSMAAAVRAVVDYKFGAQGVFRAGVRESAWREPAAIANAAKEPSAAAIEATIAHCEYIYDRYGRFPAYQPPFRTVLGFQTGHVDTGFYDRYYKPEALSDAQRNHMAHWHA